MTPRDHMNRLLAEAFEASAGHLAQNPTGKVVFRLLAERDEDDRRIMLVDAGSERDSFLNFVRLKLLADRMDRYYVATEAYMMMAVEGEELPEDFSEDERSVEVLLLVAACRGEAWQESYPILRDASGAFSGLGDPNRAEAMSGRMASLLSQVKPPLEVSEEIAKSMASWEAAAQLARPS